jgi:very-short-patch-repair endonuclease
VGVEIDKWADIPMPRIQQGNPQNLSRKRSLRSEMTSAERRLWSRLRGKQFFGLKFRRQHGVGPYIVDFYCSERLTVIEVDGHVHGEELQKRKDAEGKELEESGIAHNPVCQRRDLEKLGRVLEDLKMKLGV